MWKTLCFGTVVILCLFSCDCMQYLQCRVVDANTGEPLEGASYYRESIRYASETDSTGYFEGYRISNGFNCRPRLKYHVEKDEYVPAEVEWKPSRDRRDTIVIPMQKKR